MSKNGTFVPLEKRSARRVMAPSKTKALLITKNITLDHMQVKEISLVGMLVCGNDKIERFFKDSFIDDICISIPLDEAITGAKTFLFLGEGRIVRSFTDEASQTVCYGVEFLHDSLYLKQRLMTVLETVSPESNINECLPQD